MKTSSYANANNVSKVGFNKERPYSIQLETTLQAHFQVVAEIAYLK